MPEDKEAPVYTAEKILLKRVKKVNMKKISFHNDRFIFREKLNILSNGKDGQRSKFIRLCEF
jgi:hypothetical protein